MVSCTISGTYSHGIRTADVRSTKISPAISVIGFFSGSQIAVSRKSGYSSRAPCSHPYEVPAGRARRSFPIAKASDDSFSELDSEKLLGDLKEKWSAVDNKPAVALYAGGALTLIWLSSAIVGAIGSIPLLPKVLELVGVGYSAWFVYRYLLFKSSRKELASELEELKSKVTGAARSKEEEG